jgi:hypothetical protein
MGVVALTGLVAKGLYKSYRELSPAQGTRERRSRRSIFTPLFAALSLTSLALAGYSATQYATLSYKVWADQRAVEVPSRFVDPTSTRFTETSHSHRNGRVYGEKGILPYGDNSTRVYLAQWLTDTPIYLDAFEIIAEKARRFWWGQQVELAFVSWSLLLSIEGRRKNIPYLWAYLALGHLVSLSFAQNLFYLALLLTPTPIARDTDGGEKGFWARLQGYIVTPKPAGWTPHPSLAGLVLTQSFGLLFAAPLAAGTESAAKLLVVQRVLAYLPLVIPAVVPVSWGTTHVRAHEAYDGHTELFRYASMASFLLQTKALATGLLYNAPEAYQHRHSKFIPFDWEKRSAFDRTSTAFGKILGSTSDHPVVGAVARDVLLSGFSLAVWAAVRSLDINDVLASATPLFRTRASSAGRQLIGSRGGGDKPGRTLEPSSGLASSTRSSRRSRVGASRRPLKDEAEDDDGMAGDGAYEPTAAAAEGGAVVESDVTPRDEADLEAAALAWGLNVLGGLGSGSAGVFGAECISR